ncbi:glycosyl transferase family protein [Mesobacterium pallidum]|uniref:glycosyl transferase family protein n=1 Tax=Mesobacterium pallidum TaxID=2872037 RepID=UPI001EE1B1CB|nr:glycosyl transferase family protein [Mesobacterium pallidum]
MLSEPHPFAQFVAILGRGKTKQRHLTRAEARESMAMILRGEALPEQIGAYLMLLRLKEESPEEIAGFVDGTRDTFRKPPDAPLVDLDWSSYAGKRTQLPWFLLSVLALVGAGHRVCLHGTEGHTAGRLYTRDVLTALGLPVSTSLGEAGAQIKAQGFSYLPLEAMSPKLRELIELRPILGLRSPVHSFSRLLNPFDAPAVMQGIFHRGFMDIHAGAAQALAIHRCAVFRGEGGEIERRPNKPVEVWTTEGTADARVETWPALLPNGHAPAEEEMDPALLLGVWRGEITHAYGEAAAIGTLAMALRCMGLTRSIVDAEAQARGLWQARDRARLVAA